MLFILKKTVSALLSPLLCAALLLCAGVALLAARRSRRQARWGLGCACASLGLLLAASCQPLIHWLSQPLETAYGAYRAASGQPVRHVVVLGSGHHASPVVPATGWLDAAAQTRLLEGLRVQRLHPGSRLLFTGGGGEVPHPQAQVMAARAAGAAADALEAAPELLRDTAAEARYLARRLGDEPFALVTSAWHMPRAMRLMRLHGARALPAPARHADSAPIQARDWAWTQHWWPPLDPSALGKSHQLLHETVGLLWLALGAERTGAERTGEETDRRR